MRRTLATIILGPSLLLASLAWSSFALLNTMLNPERSEKVASVLLDDPLVQQQLRQTVASAVGDQLPDVVPVSDETLEAGAGVALANPAVEVLIRDAMVEAHQAFLGEGDLPTEIDLGAVAGDVRANTLGDVPGANELLPDSPSLTIDLPTENIPNLGGFRRWLARAAPLLAIMAAAGVALAVLTTTHRPSVMRRAGFWALGASAIWLFLNLFVPWAATQWFSGQAAIAASLVEAMFGEMLRPALVLAGLGIALLLISLIVPTFARDQRVGRTDGGVVMRRNAEAQPEGLTPLYEAPKRPRATAAGLAPLPSPAPSPAPSQPRPVPTPPPAATPPAPSQPRPAKASPSRPTHEPAPQRRSEPAEQAWVPGVGYVDPAVPPTEPSTRPQASAPVEQTWIPGVGYVDATDSEPNESP